MKKKKDKDEKSEKAMNFNPQRMQYEYDTEYMSNYGGSYKSILQDGYMMDNAFNGVMINPKQIYWICKRKARREFLDGLMVYQKNNYMHESRHRHAMKRMRAPSGRFLTKDEMNKLEKEQLD